MKVWELAAARCSLTFTEHTQAVWAAEFHADGDFLLSGSMDHTARVWDLVAAKCRQTLRGHVDRYCSNHNNNYNSNNQLW